ncbi:hypothetical protein SAMN04488074_13644 [Lentzea albidocapillata subsp. violacea]|uniref:Uncharacterized protein n=1 Tax=Lentzea albidocapillata subsp. violacea TaxID=128104 RepID=A0A1G9YZK9_9PSEU|nr:hypothetical protein [Lentzea albidocapillata]SDN14568.1 hypothetical protein SAMN04488074_13644 [Lentzea albidocapillata subsp. violacea]
MNVTGQRSHNYADCDGCHEADADLRIRLDDDEGTARWCYQCAGGLLRTLTSAGIVVTASKLVRPVEPAADVPEAAHDPGWTVDLAVEVLQAVTPQAVQLIRTLVEHEGNTTAQTLREVLGVAQVGPVTKSLNTAARHLWRGERLAAKVSVATPRQQGGLGSVVESYELPAGTVAIWNRALLRLDRARNDNEADQ